MKLTPIQLMEEINKCRQALTQCNTQLKTLGVILARKQHDYSIELAKKELRVRKIERYPGNLVADISKGDEQVARLGLERDIAKIDYEVCREGLRNIRLELDALRSLLAWEKAEYLNS